MQPTVYQKPELRDANDNIIQQGAFGKNTALCNATNNGWIDYVMNNLEFLYGIAKDEVVPVPALPASGQTNKTYLLTTTGVSYRWSGTQWVAVSSSEAVGRAESAALLAEQWATKTDGTVDGTEYSAKYYAQQAEASADDAQDVADDMADHLVQIDKNTGGVAKNSKRISNIEKLLQGNLYDYDTDDDVAYTKTVPSGALPYAGVEKLGGKTLVMNQLVNSGTTSVATTNGHKYYTLIDGTASIVTSSGSAITIVDDTADMVCDLTLMFGAGNEPSTVQEFQQMFPADWYPYNAGTLLSAGVTGVKSQSANLLPTYTTDGSGNGLTWKANADGSVTINGTASATTTIDAPVSTWEWDGTTPCRLSGCPAGGDINSGYSLRVDDSRHRTYSSYDVGNGIALRGGALLVNVPIHFRIVIRSGVVCNNLTFRPMLNYGESANAYTPYIDITTPIPTEVRALDGYGWSAGTAHNYVDFERKVFVKCVERFDLGSINWLASDNYYGSWAFYQTDSLTNYKATNINTVGNFVTSRYVSDSITGMRNNATAPCMAIFTNGNINIRDTSFAVNELARLKESLQGVYLYYELATPIETDISQYLTDNLLEVGAGGKLTFENSNGNDYHIPVQSEVTYMIDLQEAIENGN